MRWNWVVRKNGEWVWWAYLPDCCVAWVIDDSGVRGLSTCYRVAASVNGVTFFTSDNFNEFAKAKSRALDLVDSIQNRPLEIKSGRFAKSAKRTQFHK